MSDRPGPRSVMSKLDRLLIDGGKHYTTADRIYAEVIAPLLVEAERRGAERGWGEGWDAAVDAGERCDVAGGDFTCGNCAVCCTPNPYRAGDDQ